MDDAIKTIGMTPPHLGRFIRGNLPDERKLSVAPAAYVVGRAPVDLVR
jgi:hypothetical protein